MEQDYSYCMNVVFQLEGGYGWDKNDPGGPTKWGITCYDLAEYENKTMNSMSDWVEPIKDMTIAVADNIYTTKYKVKCRFDDIRSGIDFAFLDYGINSGTSRPIRVAQKLLNLKVDGIFGPITLNAINSQDPETFINEMCNERLHFMESLSTWKDFGDGWSARVRTVRSDSIKLITNTPSNVLPMLLLETISKRSAKAYVPMVS